MIGPLPIYELFLLCIVKMFTAVAFSLGHINSLESATFFAVFALTDVKPIPLIIIVLLIACYVFNPTAVDRYLEASCVVPPFSHRPHSARGSCCNLTSMDNLGGRSVVSAFFQH